MTWKRIVEIVGVLAIILPGLVYLIDLKSENNKLLDEKARLQESLKINEEKLDRCEKSLDIYQKSESDLVEKEQLFECQKQITLLQKTLEQNNVMVLGKNNCWNERKNLQKKLDHINSELSSGWSEGFVKSPLSAEETEERKQQQEQLNQQLKVLQCN